MRDRVSTDRFELRVRSYELDSYAHVNNGAYVSWFEDARERLLRRKGRDYAYYPHHSGAWFVVVHIAIDYLAQGHGGDDLTIESRLVSFGRTSVVWRHVARRTKDRRILARARVVMAFADDAGSSTAIPADFRECFEAANDADRWFDDEGGERA